MKREPSLRIREKWMPSRHLDVISIPKIGLNTWSLLNSGSTSFQFQSPVSCGPVPRSSTPTVQRDPKVGDLDLGFRDTAVHRLGIRGPR